jgi:hypothetical protein
MTIVSVTIRSLCRLATTSLIAAGFCTVTSFGAAAQGIGIGTGMMLNGSADTCVAAPDDGYAGEYADCRLAPTLIGGSNPTSQERKDRRTSTSGRRRGGDKPIIKHVGKKKQDRPPSYGACGGCDKNKFVPPE